MTPSTSGTSRLRISPAASTIVLLIVLGWLFWPRRAKRHDLGRLPDTWRSRHAEILEEELRQGDERGRKILERAEALNADELMRMHGTVRSLRPLDGDDRAAPGSPFGGESRR